MAAIIHSVLLESAFGEPVLLGIAAMAIVFLWITKGGINTFGITLTGLGALCLYLGGVGMFDGGYLPQWVAYLVVMMLAILFALGFLKMVAKS